VCPAAVCITVYQMLMINEKAIHPYPIVALRLPINLLFPSNLIQFSKLRTLLLWFLNETHILYVGIIIIIIILLSFSTYMVQRSEPDCGRHLFVMWFAVLCCIGLS
jgi:hypothetical protein